ncbi:CMRF35-like molecule 1 [Fukomys damarensis]|uniref:CMRF35-like molecule 1 n=1 Tax=Fukomys damarensis TaxID=885580 RepID=A0A091DHF4_FUKDA|nr:CMRF35-like molecule 1 [Fukomys damarensis]
MYLLRFFPLLFWFSGFSAARNGITGPETVSGLERGSLTVQCHYSSAWETYPKWWCRGARWSSCKILIKTNGSEKKVKEERLSIRDHQKKHVFSVTMEDLRGGDADSYWCGIERIGTDLGVKVKVTIDPVTTEDTRSLLTLPNYHSNGRYSIVDLKVLLPIIFAVLLLLLAAASLLAWGMVKRQKKDRVTPSLCSHLQPLEGDLCYANLSLHQPGTSSSSSWPKASTKSSSAQATQQEVEYVTMAPFPREEISYASLCLDPLDQEPVYSNTGHTPSRACEESAEYTSIRRS